MTRPILAAALIALVLPFVPGCGSDGPVGHVRLVNATTDFATMDLYADGEQVLSGVAASSVSGYADVKEGSRVLDVHNGGSGISATTTTQTIATDHRYSLVAYVTGGAVTTQFLNEDESAPTGANAKLRVLNGAVNEVGSVDVYLTTNDCGKLGVTDIAVASGVSGLQSAFATFGAASGAGTAYNVCVTASGSKSDIRLSTSITFTAGQVANFVLTPTTGGVLLNGLLLNQQGSATAYANQLARVRLVADAADGSSVSAAFGSTSVGISGLSPAVLSYVAVTAGTVTPTITINGTAVAAPSMTLTAGADYTLLVAGTAAAPTVSNLADDNTPSTDSNLTVKIRLVNGVNGMATTAGLKVNGAPLINSVPFGQSSSYVQVAASTGTTLVGLEGSSPIWTDDSLTLTAKTNYTVFLLGDAATVGTQSVLSTDN